MKLHLGRNIAALRKKASLSQEQLADEVKSKHKAIGSIEEGRVVGNVIRLKMIADYFKVSLDDLCFKNIAGDEVKPPVFFNNKKKKFTTVPPIEKTNGKNTQQRSKKGAEDKVKRVSKAEAKSRGVRA